ncbi:MAG: DUF551 domain-containing protein [Roseburia sp.]|nr:DUF551 domain-containing protein [Roseburia sp.]MBQ8279568.1 DUF551 domain-containing protein [Roseburia sp.]
MKEFIEKLIGRFQEYIETAKAEGDYTYIEPFEIAKNAVNQLAEEYSVSEKNAHTGWIPCSERLPEVNGWYLATNELGVVQQQYWGASHWQKLRDDAVIAWQPLPEPYTPPTNSEIPNNWQQQTMNRFERVE